MQGVFESNEEAVKDFRRSISEARFARYLKAGNGDQLLAIKLYHWNALLSQSMYLPLQMWEIALRNKLNQFLIWKYNQSWPYDQRALRTFTRNDNRRLQETKDRFDPQRLARQVPTDAIVADLSAGFWVSLVTKSYDIPFSWRYNLSRILPYADGLDRASVSTMSDRLLDLRNRVAHHEPILHFDLPLMRTDVATMVKGMCNTTSAYLDSSCTFQTVWAAKPIAA